MKTEERSGLSLKVDDDDQIMAVIVNDRYSSTKDIAEKLDVLHKCVENRLWCLGYQKKLNAYPLGSVSERGDLVFAISFLNAMTRMTLF